MHLNHKEEVDKEEDHKEEEINLKIAQDVFYIASKLISNQNNNNNNNNEKCI